MTYDVSQLSLPAWDAAVAAWRAWYYAAAGGRRRATERAWTNYFIASRRLPVYAATPMAAAWGTP